MVFLGVLGYYYVTFSRMIDVWLHGDMQRYGANTETMMGLSGLGDLILTCSSPQSRNFSFGVNLGKGLATKDIHGKTGLAEGAFTASVLVDMARDKKIDMPIAEAIAAVLAGQISVDAAIESLLARPLRSEE